MTPVGRALAFTPVLVILSACSGSDDSSMSLSPALAVQGAAGTTGGMTAPASTYTITATVTGLTGSGLTLELNSGQSVPIADNGPVTFPAQLANGAAYTVTVQTQPTTSREVCGIGNASGTITGANATVSVNCAITAGFLYQVQLPGTASASRSTNGQIVSYGITAGTQALVPVGQSAATGFDPSAVATASGGRFLYVANQLSSTISIYGVESDTGALTALGSVDTPGMQPNQMLISAGGFLFVYGQVPGQPGLPRIGYALNSFAISATTGALTPTGTALSFDPEAGTGFVATPDGRWLYLLTGDLSSNTPALETLTAYEVDPATGALTPGPVLSWMTTWNDPTSPTTVMAMDPLGRYLYLTSNQSSPTQPAATVLPYAIDSTSGALTSIGTGTPVASDAGMVTVDPSGRYLYLLDNLGCTAAACNTLTALAIDQGTGEVTVTQPTIFLDGPPSSILCDPSGQFVYVPFFIQDGDLPVANVATFSISTNPASAGQLMPFGKINQLQASGDATTAFALVD
jgi:6-phosphogluconolactonase (cycloisomerase 2 family)